MGFNASPRDLAPSFPLPQFCPGPVSSAVWLIMEEFMEEDYPVQAKRPTTCRPLRFLWVMTLGSHLRERACFPRTLCSYCKPQTTGNVLIWKKQHFVEFVHLFLSTWLCVHCRTQDFLYNEKIIDISFYLQLQLAKTIWSNTPLAKDPPDSR